MNTCNRPHVPESPLNERGGCCDHQLGDHLGEDGELGCRYCKCSGWRYRQKGPSLTLDVARHTVKTTSKSTTLRLSAAGLRSLLIEDGADIPPDAEIYVRVPGGGDWSNSKLSIQEHLGPSSDGVELLIEWETVEHEEH